MKSSKRLEQTRYGERLSPTGARIAHPGLRAAAFAIDGFTVILLVTLVVSLGFVVNLPVLFGIGITTVPILAAVAATISTGARGFTLGKHALGLRVVNARTGQPTGWRSSLRSLVIVAPLLITYCLQGLIVSWSLETIALLAFPTLPVLLWLALLIVLWLVPQHRGLQDLAGGSLVVHIAS